MNHSLARISALEDFRCFDEIIDVRSPAEFAEDHVPGAINCPVLDDAQRREVGTLYTQSSPFAARKVGAAYVAENIAFHLRHRFQEHAKDWRPLILCWRGGQRSAALTLILRKIGWDAQQLVGGYKTYRSLAVTALAALPERYRFIVVCGPTGSAKSRVLQKLAQLGEQVLDLEELACHKGSVFGALAASPQPSQKSFESRLLAALTASSPERPLYVEAESRKIGQLQLPNELIAAIRASQCLSIEASFEARVDYLLRDYAYFLEAPEWLDSRIGSLAPWHSRETIGRWAGHITARQWRPLVCELLESHYDPLYRRSQKRNFAAFDRAAKYAANDLSPAGIENLAQQIIAEGKSQGEKPATARERA